MTIETLDLHWQGPSLVEIAFMENSKELEGTPTTNYKKNIVVFYLLSIFFTI